MLLNRYKRQMYDWFNGHFNNGWFNIYIFPLASNYFGILHNQI